jgi:antigen flippase
MASGVVNGELPVNPTEVCTEQEQSQKSYGQILKSSALIGGSQVLNIGIGIVRTKAMAILLGPAGFGLFGVYGSIATLTQNVASMGVNSSGVRQIAEAVGSGDKDKISLTTAVLRRTSVVLGLIGAAFLLIFSRQVSKVTFGNPDHTSAVALLSLVVFLTIVSSGQSALIQGMRRIADLAKVSVLGALFGAFMSIPLVYFFREKGVVASLISVAAMTIITSWWYSRKIDVQASHVTFSDIKHEAAALLKLGSAFMASGLMVTGVAFGVRALILRTIGLEATGFYQSSWTLGGLYVGFILQAMGADFYPRLTASIHNHKECNRLVNEQTLVGVLLAGPGVIATLTLAPVIIALFYSTNFGAAVPLLRWICLGTMLQVITYPMGFIIVAKGNQKIFFIAEFAWTVVALALAWVCLRTFGLNGAGIAFFGSYVFHAFLIFPIVHRMSGFNWSSDSKQVGTLFLSLIAIVFCGFYVVPTMFAIAFGVVATVGSTFYSIRMLTRLVPIDHLPRRLRLLLLRFGLAHPETNS